jgi:HSP20 family protein
MDYKNMRNIIKRLSGLDKKDTINLQTDDDLYDEDVEEEEYDEDVEDEEEEETDEENWPEEDLEEEGQLSIDVYQTPKNIVVKSTIAGVTPEDIDISINNDMLTIRGKRHLEKEMDEQDYLFRECYWGTFSRSIILPVEIEADRIEAEMENGVLSVTLPKAKPTKQISIKVKEK